MKKAPDTIKVTFFQPISVLQTPDLFLDKKQYSTKWKIRSFYYNLPKLELSNSQNDAILSQFLTLKFFDMCREKFKINYKLKFLYRKVQFPGGLFNF